MKLYQQSFIATHVAPTFFMEDLESEQNLTFA